MDEQLPPTNPPLTLASVVVSLLIIVVAGLLLVLFVLPNNSPWFWPTLGAMVMLAGIALAIPLRKK